MSLPLKIILASIVLDKKVISKDWKISKD